MKNGSDGERSDMSKRKVSADEDMLARFRVFSSFSEATFLRTVLRRFFGRKDLFFLNSPCAQFCNFTILHVLIVQAMKLSNIVLRLTSLVERIAMRNERAHQTISPVRSAGKRLAS